MVVYTSLWNAIEDLMSLLASNAVDDYLLQEASYARCMEQLEEERRVEWSNWQEPYGVPE